MAERGLLNPAEMVERRAQSVDLAAAGLDRGIDRRLSEAALRLSNSAARLRRPRRGLPRSARPCQPWRAVVAGH